MVKLFLSLFLLCSLSFAGEQSYDLDDKIQSLMDSGSYEKNRDYIKILFSPKSSFYNKDRVNVLKVVQTLEENGLLNLHFKSPRELHLNFQTSGSPLFFVKMLSDSLRDIGYYRYVTESSNLDESEFTWSIVLTSEYAADPMLLQKELDKKGCKIIDIVKHSSADWTYVIDMSEGFLNIDTLRSNENIILKRSLYSHWLDISKVQHIAIKSSSRNDWYPYIVFYDKSLHLLELVKKDAIQSQITLEVPKYAKYMKVSDMYSLKNIKDDLSVEPTGTR
ncbi:hypothetical protein KKG77_04375 [bacterium]|nr:hypothetical protein [bacterium]